MQTLSDVCLEVVDCEHKTAPTSPSGSYPSIRTSNIKNGRIDFQAANRVDRAAYEEWTRRRIPEPGDLILAREAPVGDVGLIPKGKAPCLGQRTVLIAPDRSQVEPRYLLYLLLTPPVQHSMQTKAAGSTVPHLNMSDIRGLALPDLPSIGEQRAIAHVLGTLDDKIELNREMSHTLEATAQAIFRSWFVDFDPVVAKADGRKPFGMSEDVAALFPDRFVESELGPIPEGWEPSSVKKEFKLTMGQSPPGTTYNETGTGAPFYQGRTDFGFRFPSRRVFCTAPTRFAEEGDTLVSVRAPVGDINMASERCSIGRGLSAARHLSGSSSFTYYSMRALEPEFMVFEGEGTLFGSMSKKKFEGIRVTRPPLATVAAFQKVAGPLDERLRIARDESQTLADLRDILLPKLLSGEIRVDEAEKTVEEAV